MYSSSVLSCHVIVTLCSIVLLVESSSSSNSVPTDRTVPNSTGIPPPSSTILDTLIVHLINSQLSSTNSHQQSVESNQSNLNHVSSIVQQFVQPPSPPTSSSSTAKQQQLTSLNSNSSSNSTQIEAKSPDDCVDGRNYWNGRDERCVDCTRKCPNGAYAYRNCNRTADLQCMCHKGAFMSVADGTCKKCSDCQPGWGVWRTCRWSRNTVCRKCQPGTYSGANVGTLGCIPCTKCGPHQEMLSECDGNRDTVCVDRETLANFSHYFINPIDDSLLLDESGDSGNTAGNSGLDGSNNYLLSDGSRLQAVSIGGGGSGGNGRFTHHHQPSYSLPFYCAILVVVVFSLCIYALIQLRCSLIHHNHRQHGGRSGSPNHDLEQNKLMLLANSSSTTSSSSSTSNSSLNSPTDNSNSNSCFLTCSHNSNSNNGKGNHPNGTTIPITWTTIGNHSPNNISQLYPSYPPPQYSFDQIPPPIKNLYRTSVPTQNRHSFQNHQHRSSQKKPQYKAYYELLYAPNDSQSQQQPQQPEQQQEQQQKQLQEQQQKQLQEQQQKQLQEQQQKQQQEQQQKQQQEQQQKQLLEQQQQETQQEVSKPPTKKRSKPLPGPESIKYRSEMITEEMLEGVEKNILKESGSWKRLAKELGYTESQINEFELKSSTINESKPVETTTTPADVPDSTTTINATRLLLADWSIGSKVPLSSTLARYIPDHIPVTEEVLSPPGAPERTLSDLIRALARTGHSKGAFVIHTILLASSLIPCPEDLSDNED